MEEKSYDQTKDSQGEIGLNFNIRPSNDLYSQKEIKSKITKFLDGDANDDLIKYLEHYFATRLHNGGFQSILKELSSLTPPIHINKLYNALFIQKKAKPSLVLFTFMIILKMYHTNDLNELERLQLILEFMMLNRMGAMVVALCLDCIERTSGNLIKFIEDYPPLFVDADGNDIDLFEDDFNAMLFTFIKLFGHYDWRSFELAGIITKAVTSPAFHLIKLWAQIVSDKKKAIFIYNLREECDIPDNVNYNEDDDDENRKKIVSLLSTFSCKKEKFQLIDMLLDPAYRFKKYRIHCNKKILKGIEGLQKIIKTSSKVKGELPSSPQIEELTNKIHHTINIIVKDLPGIEFYQNLKRLREIVLSLKINAPNLLNNRNDEWKQKFVDSVLTMIEVMIIDPDYDLSYLNHITNFLEISTPDIISFNDEKLFKIIERYAFLIKNKTIDYRDLKFHLKKLIYIFRNTTVMNRVFDRFYNLLKRYTTQGDQQFEVSLIIVLAFPISNEKRRKIIEEALDILHKLKKSKHTEFLVNEYLNCIFNNNQNEESLECSDHPLTGLLNKVYIERLLRRYPKFCLQIFSALRAFIDGLNSKDYAIKIIRNICIDKCFEREIPAREQVLDSLAAIASKRKDDKIEIFTMLQRINTQPHIPHELPTKFTTGENPYGNNRMDCLILDIESKITKYQKKGAAIQGSILSKRKVEEIITNIENGNSKVDYFVPHDFKNMILEDYSEAEKLKLIQTILPMLSHESWYVVNFANGLLQVFFKACENKRILENYVECIVSSFFHEKQECRDLARKTLEVFMSEIENKRILENLDADKKVKFIENIVPILRCEDPGGSFIIDITNYENELRNWELECCFPDYKILPYLTECIISLFFHENQHYREVAQKKLVDLVSKFGTVIGLEKLDEGKKVKLIETILSIPRDGDNGFCESANVILPYLIVACKNNENLIAKIYEKLLLRAMTTSTFVLEPLKFCMQNIYEHISGEGFLQVIFALERIADEPFRTKFLTEEISKFKDNACLPSPLRNIVNNFTMIIETIKRTKNSERYTPNFFAGEHAPVTELDDTDSLTAHSMRI